VTGKVLLFWVAEAAGIRNTELIQLRLTEVDLQTCQVRNAQGKG
jgi:integrase/recombinase XerD